MRYDKQAGKSSRAQTCAITSETACVQRVHGRDCHDYCLKKENSNLRTGVFYDERKGTNSLRRLYIWERGHDRRLGKRSLSQMLFLENFQERQKQTGQNDHLEDFHSY